VSRAPCYHFYGYLTTFEAHPAFVAMWLIDSTTIRLKFVHGPSSSPYAILSHTWNDNDEVIFQEFISPDRDVTHSRFRKITETCRLARERGIPYVWVDSCCIDKTSSAELTEAINSMFRWYTESTVCFTYLADLAVYSKIDSALRNCKWFTRGWTLQELVAPKNVEFYDESWNFIGLKINLLEELPEITRIHKDVLRDNDSLPNFTVATRMSWAAHRQTTREEDLAYCLLGIFDVHLPLIYGEGSNAFIRLQEAIAQVTCDLSLFAWTDQDEQERRQRYRGILARSPAEFKDCHSFVRPPPWAFPTLEYTITNKGLRLRANLLEAGSPDGEEYSFLSLECGGQDPVFIRLVQIPGGYVRCCSDSIDVLSVEDVMKLPQGQRREIYISKTLTPIISESLTMRLGQGYYVEIHNKTRNRCELVRKFPEKLWNLQRGCFMVSPNEDFTGLVGLSISRDFDVIKESNPGDREHPKSLSWPRVLILIMSLWGGSDKHQFSASILPTREGNQITDLPLECSVDVVFAVLSLHKDNPQWNPMETAGDIVVVPSTPPSQGQDYGYDLMRYAVKVTVSVTVDQSSIGENNLPNASRVVISVDPTQV
jgi:hypothetical protein